MLLADSGDNFYEYYIQDIRLPTRSAQRVIVASY